MFETYRTIDEFKQDNGYTIDGAWYPRVTKIVSIKNKPALYRFYAEVPDFKTGQAISEKSAEEGTRVHEAVQSIMLSHDPQYDDAIAPAVAAYQEFAKECRIETKPEFIERRIRNRDHRYAGTIDALAKIDGKFGVLDIKTSVGIYRDYNLQTAAYIEALKSEFEDIETRWILRIDQAQTCIICKATRRTKGGREKIKLPYPNRTPYHQHEWSYPKGIVELQEFPFWQDDFEAFLGAKKLWEWENQEWLKKTGYL